MKETYYWVPWFKELSKKVAEYADGGQREFLEKARQINWDDEGKVIQQIEDHQKYFDPFSFLYTVASKNTPKSGTIVYGSISDIFELSDSIENEIVEYFIHNRATFPTPLAQRLLFWDKNHLDKRNPDVLWRLLKCAVEGLNKIDSKDFSDALEIKGVGVRNLSQTLSLINATEFLSTDDSLVSLNLEIFSRVPTTDPQVRKFQLNTYKDILNSIRDIFPNCELYEIGLFAYELFSDKTNLFRDNVSKYFQVSTNVINEGTDEWETFLENDYVYTGGEYSALFKAGRGSIVVVRNGEYNLYGIGVVSNNEYLESGVWDDNKKIHVIWVNKQECEIAERLRIRTGFTHAFESTLTKIKTVESYRRTIEQLEKINPQPCFRCESQSPTPRNQILYGPPGTGKTWHTVNLSLAVIHGVNVDDIDDEDRMDFNDYVFNISEDSPDGKGQIAFTTFHQNYAYEDFVEGIRPTMKGSKVGYERRDGIFKKLAKSAEDNPTKRYVLIIDEINRGNIAKIFGELITLIEDSKRLGEPDVKEVLLPYSQHSFGVPPNLFIIGTMNTADRSIQILDTALRRRFNFVEMMPEPSHEKMSTDIEGISCEKILKSMNRRIIGLLDRERQIGHTYFFGITTIEQLADVFQNRIIPLLQEYFFDDWSKIRAVLGKNAFVREDVISDPSLVEYRDSEIKFYERLPANDEKWNDPQQYEKIYQN